MGTAEDTAAGHAITGTAAAATTASQSAAAAEDTAAGPERRSRPGSRFCLWSESREATFSIPSLLVHFKESLHGMSIESLFC
jgi:hypothetical protein